MPSILHVVIRVRGAPGPACSAGALTASTIHMTTPPTSSEVPITVRLSRCLPMTFVNRNAGAAVTTKATRTRPSGCVSSPRSPRSPAGYVDRNVCDPLGEIDRQAQDRAELNRNRVHLPIRIGQIDVQQRFSEPEMRG